MRMIVDFTFVTFYGEKGECTQLIDCERSELEGRIKAYGGFRSIEVVSIRGAR